MDIQTYEQIQPNIDAYGIKWNVPNSQIAWRISSLMDKEPDTIEMIGRMKAGELFFDIGANIGQYSLLAAKKGVRVHAFEPDSQNFAQLCKNITLNGMQDRIMAWNIALTNVVGLNTFHCGLISPGSSCHAFGDSINYQGKEKAFPFYHGSFGTTVDKFIEQYGYPNFIKIDVDGFEHRVVEGMAVLLQTANNFTEAEELKEVQIEINTGMPEHVAIIDVMKNAGYTYSEFVANKARRKEGPFQGIGNIQFFRDKTHGLV